MAHLLISIAMGLWTIAYCIRAHRSGAPVSLQRIAAMLAGCILWLLIFTVHGDASVAMSSCAGCYALAWLSPAQGKMRYRVSFNYTNL